jgi:hypothetical protein
MATILGPFPHPRRECRQEGVYEHIVSGPVTFALYTSLPWSDERVQAAVAAYLATATPRSVPGPDPALVDAVARAREARAAAKAGSTLPRGADRSGD